MSPYAQRLRDRVGHELLLLPAVTDLINTYPNGDDVAYVTVAYECRLPSGTVPVLEQDELIETVWMRAEEIQRLPRHEWIDRVIADA